jgi:hypothetical protein
MSILDSLMELDPIKVFKKDMLVPVDFLYRLKLIRHKIRDLRGVEGFEREDTPLYFDPPLWMELDGQGKLLSEEQDSGGLTKLVSEEHDDLAALLDRYFSMSDM